MPAAVSKDATLLLTVDGQDYSCQVIDASYTPAAPAESTIIPTACGDTVAEPGDPQNGSITGTVFKDNAGMTRALATLVLSGAEAAYVYTDTDGNGAALSWSGTCTVPAFGIDFQPDKLGRHPLELSVITSVLAPA